YKSKRLLPAKIREYAAPVQILLPGLFPFFRAWRGLIFGVQLVPYQGIQLLLQSLPDFILVCVIIAKMILHQRHEQVVGNLHILHSLLFLSATAATIATVVWAAAFSPLQPSLPSRPSSTT